VDPVTIADEIIFHNWEIDVHQGYSATSIQNITTHELGHAIGLGHSVPDNVMYETVVGRTDLGDQDKRDYHFLWTTIRWAYQL
jgi:predicted Zn-dependent protease